MTEFVTFFPVDNRQKGVDLTISIFEVLKKRLCERMHEKLVDSYRRQYGEWSETHCGDTDDIHRHATHSYAKLFLFIKPIRTTKGIFDNERIDGLKKFTDIDPSKRMFLSPGDCFDVCSTLMSLFPDDGTVHKLMEVFDDCVVNKTRLAVELVTKKEGDTFS